MIFKANVNRILKLVTLVLILFLIENCKPSEHDPLTPVVSNPVIPTPEPEPIPFTAVEY